jgi:hypothetical protein
LVDQENFDDRILEFNFVFFDTPHPTHQHENFGFLLCKRLPQIV